MPLSKSESLVTLLAFFKKNKIYQWLSAYIKLKLQYFGHLMRRVDSLEKTLMLGGIGGRRKRGRQRMRWLDGITNLIDVEFEWTPGVGDGQGGLACCDSWGRKKSDMTQRLNWTELICLYQVNVLILLNIFLKSLLERMGETTTCFIRFSGEAERKWGTISRFNSPGH